MGRFGIIWEARFSDGAKIRQFEDIDQGLERPFKEVLEQQDKLVEFSLINVVTGTIYRLDLTTGRIGVMRGNTTEVHAPEPDHSQKRVRLIYFRRMAVDMAFSGVDYTTSPEKVVAYFLGYQYNDSLGRNKKLLLQIHEDDTIWISEE
jgi:hypothetical protein